MTSASHAEGREFESRLEYFFCQFVKLHAQGTLVPYREVRRARVYLRYENSPLVHRGASTAYRGRGSPLRSDRVVRGSLVVGAASARAAWGNAGQGARGVWKRIVVLLENPRDAHLAACEALGKEQKQKVNSLTHHIHIPAKILVRPDPTKKQAGVPPPQAKCSPSTPGSLSSARILPEAPQKTTPASSTAPRARPPVRPENQAKPRAVPVQGDAAARGSPA